MRLKLVIGVIVLFTAVLFYGNNSNDEETIGFEQTNDAEVLRSNDTVSQIVNQSELNTGLGAYDATNSFYSEEVVIDVIEKRANYSMSPTSLHNEFTTTDVPGRKNMNHVKKMPVSMIASDDKDVIPATAQNKSTQSTIEALDFNDNGSLTGFFNIPADPHGAAGPNHVVNVANTSIQFYQKNGTLDYQDSLQNFFSAVSPANGTFDPKVLYDQYLDRWVVVTLERVTAPEASRVLVAVSDDSNPNGSWFQGSVNTLLNIGGTNRWFDYPGFAVDEEAIYITGNMFSFAGNYGGNRVIIIDKGFNSGGLYDGGATSASIYDPGGFSNTHQPAHTYGAVPNGVGTWLVMYSTISNGTEEALQVTRIDDPLGTPTFNTEVFLVGDFDDTNILNVPGGPQSGTADTIDSGDSRSLSAVWRDNSLYMTTEAVAPIGEADAGEASVVWVEVDTNVLASLSTTQFGLIGGEDIAAGMYTSYGSIAVNDDGGLAIGFTATSANSFPSSYYVTRSPSDPLGTVRTPKLIRSGVDSYLRTFGSGRNRWGDYSSVAVDPDGECFWIYNKYAKSQGNSSGGEDGRWATAFAHECNDEPSAGGNSITVDEDGTVTIVNNGDSTVLNNDSDPDTDDTLTTLIVSGPSDASSFTFNLDGTFSYTHNGDENSSDSFVYEACDDGTPVKCDSANVNITINNINDDPDAINDGFCGQ